MVGRRRASGPRSRALFPAAHLRPVTTSGRWVRTERRSSKKGAVGETFPRRGPAAGARRHRLRSKRECCRGQRRRPYRAYEASASSRTRSLISATASEHFCRTSSTLVPASLLLTTEGCPGVRQKRCTATPQGWLRPRTLLQLEQLLRVSPHLVLQLFQLLRRLLSRERLLGPLVPAPPAAHTVAPVRGPVSGSRVRGGGAWDAGPARTPPWPPVPCPPAPLCAPCTRGSELAAAGTLPGAAVSGRQCHDTQ